jgi:hypothetical protein
MKGKKMNKILLLAMVVVFITAGCSSSGGGVTAEAKSAGQSAWNTFNFVNNVANPLYYGQKIAEKEYDSYKAKKAAKNPK